RLPVADVLRSRGVGAPRLEVAQRRPRDRERGGALVAGFRGTDAAEQPVVPPQAALAAVEPVDDPAVAALVRAAREPGVLAEQPPGGGGRARPAALVGRGAAARHVE